jgi:hypothetical protein
MVRTLTAPIILFLSTAAAADQTVGVFVNEPEAMDGYTLFAPSGSTSTYLIDNEGDLVHEWVSTDQPGQSVYLLEDGDLMRTGSPSSVTSFRTGGAGGLIERIEWDGTVSWSHLHASADHRQHHDIAVLPSGNVLALSWRWHSRSEAIQAGRDSAWITGRLWSDSIVEIEPSGSSGGTIVWRWNAWDHLVQDHDATLDGYGDPADHPGRIDINWPSEDNTMDWLHLNAVDYNAELDQIVVSCPRFNEIWIIDHDTSTEEAAGSAGDLIYRWGNPAAYGRGDTADQQLFFQHDARWILDDCPGAGDITVFNNGAGRPDGAYSSIEQITPPLLPDATYQLSASNPWGPLLPTWSWTADPAISMYSSYISGAQRLANGNTLVCVGAAGEFLEVSPALGEDIAWQYINPVTQSGIIEQGEAVPWNQNTVFRATRYASDYIGLAGQDLTPGSPIEGPLCAGDISGDDDIVGVSDLLLLLSGWGNDAAGADLAEPLDIVDTDDLLELLSQFGVCGS